MKLGILLSAIILTLSVLGARLASQPLIYGMIGVICLLVLLVAFDRVNSKAYPIALFSIGAALLFQSTLLSNYLVGTDVHTEYYFFNRVQAEGGWDYSLPHSYAGTLGSTIIAPFLSDLLHVAGYWVYKIIFPLFFASVPIILYYLFKGGFGAKVSFLSVFFFLSVPTWSLEMIGLPRQMLAEIFFALCLLLLVAVPKWGMRVKVPLLLLFALLGAAFHYVVGPVILLYLGGAACGLLFFRRRTFPVKCLVPVVGVFLVLSTFYYGWVAQGIPLENISGGLSKQVGKVIDPPPPSEITIPTTPFPDQGDEPLPPVGERGYFQKQEPLIRTAIGLDFMKASPWGKVFRLFQFLTQLALVVGCVWLWRNRKRFPPEYLVLCGVSAALLAACIFLPMFSNIINATRFYHMALFLLAPMLVVGGIALFRNVKVFVIALLIPYFLFTSGAVFEATKQPSIETIDIPYSISLSYERVTAIGGQVFTRNDVEVRDWAVSNLDPVAGMFADINGCLLFSERMEMEWDLRWTNTHTALALGFPKGSHIFLSESNMRTRTITLKPVTGESATGTRVSYSFFEVGLDEVIAGSELVYQEGNAMIVEVGTG